MDAFDCYPAFLEEDVRAEEDDEHNRINNLSKFLYDSVLLNHFNICPNNVEQVCTISLLLTIAICTPMMREKI